jgi:hypothetical protein
MGLPPAKTTASYSYFGKMWVSRKNIWDVSAPHSGMERECYVCIPKSEIRSSKKFNIHTNHLRFFPEGVAEASQIFLWDAHVLPKLLSHAADVTGGKPIPTWSQFISSLNAIAINPLVAFYDIHGRKREVIFFYLVPESTRD